MEFGHEMMVLLTNRGALLHPIKAKPPLPFNPLRLCLKNNQPVLIRVKLKRPGQQLNMVNRQIRIQREYGVGTSIQTIWEDNQS